jgi:hypothetical protein
MAVWKDQYPSVVSHYITPQTYLGEESAEHEWNEKGEPQKLFLPTESYENFKNDESIFLFGRRGTGKTAIIRMLNYEILNKKIEKFQYVWLIEEEDTYTELSRNIRMSPLSDLPRNELIYTIKEHWRWVIYVSAMSALIKDAARETGAIKRYLSVNNLLEEGDNTLIKPFKYVTDVLNTALEEVDYEPIKVASALSKIINKLITPEFKTAKRKLLNILKEQKQNCLIIVDSIEKYELHDKISEAVVASLIEVALEFYEERYSHVFVKVAFPSEIYPHLRPLNKEKTEGKTLFIIWRHKDLVSLIAKRFYKHIKRDTNSKLESLDHFDKAKEFIYEFLPRKVITAPSIPFDTLSYIISHTQKKPRQVILLFNIILTLAKKNGNNPTNINQKEIVDGVHARLDILCNGAIDIYESIYPNSSSIVKRALKNIRSYFNAPVLDRHLNEIGALKKDADLSNDQIKQLFVESGIIGVLQNTSKYMDSNTKEFYEALFEYQIKGVLTINNKTICVIHPMFYQELQVCADMNVLVYPKPIEEEEEKQQ